MNTIYKKIKKLVNKRTFAIVLTALIVFSAISPIFVYRANAQVIPLIAGWLGHKATEKVASAITDIPYTVIGKFIYGISSIMSFIGGAVIALMAWFTGIVLNLNAQLIQTDAVQIGFSVSLSVANLGFVLGIIVIAIATILRSVNYGMKQILWKLVTAAILVNFSLVIVAPILNFTNQLTDYFLNCTQGSCRSAGGLTGFVNFSKSLAGAFNPQKGFLTALNTTNSPAVPDQNLQGAFALVGQSIGKLLVPITSVFFVLIMLIVIIISLSALNLMLFIRYLTLGVLLIIMPFAWIMWIFPNLSHLWTQWWKAFWKWTLFAPIVVFFLYLAIMTSNTMSRATNGVFAVASYQSTGDPKSPFTMLANLLGATFTPILGSIMQQLIIAGLAVGGIYAANKMSIHGADAAMGAVKAIKNTAVDYVGRQSKKGVRAAWRGVGGQRVTEGLRGGAGMAGAGQRVGAVLRKIPVLGKFAGGAGELAGAGGARLASITGRKFAELQHNKDLVEHYAKDVPKDKKEWEKNMKGSMNTEQRMAYLAHGAKEQWAKPSTVVGPKNQTLDKFKDEHDKDFENYGQNKLYKDLDKILGGTKETRELDQGIKDGSKPGQPGQGARFIVGEGGAVTDKTVDELNKKTKEFLEDFDSGDEKKIKVNEVFGKDASKEMVEALQRGLAAFAPKLVQGLMSKMDSTTLARFQGSYLKQIGEAKKMVKSMSDLTQEEKDVVLNQLEKEDERFQRRLDSNAFGYSYGTGDAGAAGAPPPAPPPAGP